MVGLEQVRQDFTVRGLPYDAALASLDLAAIYLEEGRSVEVRNLARTMGWIFGLKVLPVKDWPRSPCFLMLFSKKA